MELYSIGTVVKLKKRRAQVDDYQQNTSDQQ